MQFRQKELEMRYGKSLVPGLCACVLLVSFPVAQAQESIDVDMYQATNEGQGSSIGTVTLEKNRHGVLLVTDLDELTPGPHGFHLHENPDCSPATKDGKTTPAGAAGGHYDPENTDSHKGPYETAGHLGDLPRLYIGHDGGSEQSYLAPRIRLSDFTDRALVIHKGSDNYSDDPQPLGGGGARIACGVVPGQ
jgi:Cu-Zn family superoxide dismutase